MTQTAKLIDNLIKRCEPYGIFESLIKDLEAIKESIQLMDKYEIAKNVFIEYLNNSEDWTCFDNWLQKKL
jgi:hypothetical protein